MLKTEMRNINTTHIDTASTRQMVEMMHTENHNTLAAIETQTEQIATVIDAISARFAAGGRLFYIGCGTSGRLGVLDAAECPPTFGVTCGRVVPIMAGGAKCLSEAGESEEDSAEFGIRDLALHLPTAIDSVVGLSASGSAPYVVAALKYAKSLNCLTVSISANPDNPIGTIADLSIVAETGAEVIAGSTRLKAGTAQKLILNMISTCVMIKQGYVKENLMINLKPTNLKLRDRVIRITCELSGASYEAAEKVLEQTDWEIRDAVALL